MPAAHDDLDSVAVLALTDDMTEVQAYLRFRQLALGYMVR